MKISGPAALLLLGVLAAGTWWLAAEREREAGAPRAVEDVQPGYYLRGATLEETDASGHLTLRVRAERAQQDPATGDVRLETLRVDYHPEPARTWLLTAQRGALPPEGNPVRLAGDVRLSGRPPAGREAALIRTEALELDTDRSVATTEEPVRIELETHTVRAVGMRADLKREVVQLESAVHGNFRP